MPAALNLVGQTFARLTVESKQGINRHGQSMWNCVCECGERRVVGVGSLRNGSTKSCGCLNLEKARAPKKHGLAHQGRKHPLYNTWVGLRGRCNNPEDQAYPSYGGRGIRVCDRWDSFENFLADMEWDYQPGLSIDRKDNDGPYDPMNCRWATASVQANNKRNNLMVSTPRGAMPIAEAARAYGLHRDTIDYRIKSGWPPEVVFAPRGVRGRVARAA